MICAATWQVFDRTHLTSQVSAQNRDGSGAFIFGGGGILVPLYESGARVLQEALAGSYERIVILPHTLRGHPELLSLFDQRVHVFCRDLPSLELANKHAPAAHLYLADDLALALDVEAALNPSWSKSSWSSLMARAPLFIKSRRRKRLRRWVQGTAQIRPQSDALRLMRADVESIFAEENPQSLDLSGLYLSKFKNRIEAEWITRDFLRVLRLASRIETDRLHVSVAGSLLGKHVLMHDNSYGKNRAIYELSMRDRFSKLEWVDSRSQPGSASSAPPKHAAQRTK